MGDGVVAMDKQTVLDLIQEILGDRGVPRNIKESLQTSMNVFERPSSDNEKISELISVLDEAANDPNLSMSARTMIWNTVSVIEDMGNAV
jgi:uncharacterized protein (UPF0147 family)